MDLVDATADAQRMPADFIMVNEDSAVHCSTMCPAFYLGRRCQRQVRNDWHTHARRRSRVGPMEIFRRREKDLIREDACKHAKTWLVHLVVNARRVHGSGGSDALASRGVVE